MNKFTLTLLDTTGIQEYIFNSNRLQENIGASEIVYRATTLWVFEAIEKAGITHNIKLTKVKSDDGGETVVGWGFTAAHIEEDKSLQAEVIQAAGGNALILFREKEGVETKHGTAIEFSKKITLRILREAPGLNILIQHIPFDFENDTLPSKYVYDQKGEAEVEKKGKRRDLEEAMQIHKYSRLLPTPTLGLSVTAACSSTGLPAVRTPEGEQKTSDGKFNLLVPGQNEQQSERSRLISRETTFKLAARDLANKRLHHIIGEAALKYEFPADIDNLGRLSGEESYVAIVHADGNGMGKRVQALENAAYKDHQSKGNKILNREYIKALRNFSENLEKACCIALINVVKKVVASIDSDDKVAGKIPVIKIKNHNYIPFRPLVFGGDDVTFLCNGQLGVELATKYLQEFENLMGGYHACAGVSIVKMHYPFSRAYKLAEELTASAKEKVKESKPELDFSALDWHFAQSGLSGSLKVIRNNEYYSEDSRQPLFIRPIALKKGMDSNTRSWDEVSSIIQAFNEEPWSESHNKVVGLREPLRKGSQAVKQYRINFGLDTLPVFTEAAETGWFTDRCAYFDIIELLDHHVSLDPAPAKGGKK